jgi:hypothetical protein
MAHHGAPSVLQLFLLLGKGQCRVRGRRVCVLVSAWLNSAAG